MLVERRAASPVLPLRLLTQPLMMRLLVTGATATFGLYACVLLLPRYYQQTQAVSATRSGLFIYPLLLGLLIAVNLGAAAIARRNAFRGTLLLANGAVALGALGFTAFDTSSPAALPLLLMALIGAGVGPNLSGLQIAVQRTVRPMDLGAAMGALLLGRQLGGALALAAAETIYVGRLQAGASTESATGWSIFVVAAAGAVVAALALLTLRRGTDRIPAPPANPAVATATAAADDRRRATSTEHRPHNRSRRLHHGRHRPMTTSARTQTRAWLRRVLGATLMLTLGLATLAAIVLAGATVTSRSTHQPAPPTSTDTPMPALHTAEPGHASSPTAVPRGRRLVVAFVVGASGTVASDLLAPYDIFASSTAFTTYVVADAATPAALDGGPFVLPTYTFADVDADPTLSRTWSSCLPSGSQLVSPKRHCATGWPASTTAGRGSWACAADRSSSPQPGCSTGSKPPATGPASAPSSRAGQRCTGCAVAGTSRTGPSPPPPRWPLGSRQPFIWLPSSPGRPRHSE